jgi:type III pantothenate kinase
MNLVIDIGNSRTKVAIFEHNSLKSVDVFLNDVVSLDWIFDHYPHLKAIVSSTRNIDTKLLKENCLHYQISTPIPITNNYKCTTLGTDRLAGIIGATQLEPNKEILLFDFGTALTVDFYSQKKGYMGGTISPGLQLRFNALHNFTDKLPLVKPEGQIKYAASTTEMAIRSGVILGLVHEIEGYIKYYQQKNPRLAIFFTGGDAFYFVKRTKKTIFAIENLVLIGLNRILEYNVK